MVNATQNPVTLPRGSAAAEGAHSSRYRVIPAHGEGWQVVVEDDPNVVVFTYCSDWHRVERVCAAIDRQDRAADATHRVPVDPR